MMGIQKLLRSKRLVLKQSNMAYTVINICIHKYSKLTKLYCLPLKLFKKNEI